MRNTLIMSVLALLALSATGCFHNNTMCGGLGGGLFGSQQQPRYQQAPVVCCDPCATGGMVAQPVMAAPVMGAAPCCQ
jgi:hypothetical protein